MHRLYLQPIFILLLFTTALSCKKQSECQYMNNAEIIGYDYRACVCCGGYQVKIDSVPNPNGNPFFLATEFPPGFSVGDNPTYPIAIKLDWLINTSGCYGNYIKILRIARR